MQGRLAVLLIAVALCACTKKDVEASPSADMDAARGNLAFTCTHEEPRLPALASKANQLFLYARYLQKADGPKNFDDIMRYYRIAAAHGHYKANENAQRLIVQGLVSSPEGRKEAVDLAMQLAQAGIPGGYYDVGHYLEVGYGVEQDVPASLHYFRKAADLGSPEAQDYVAEKLLTDETTRGVAVQMWRCAAAQGYGKAAHTLANVLGAQGQLQAAVEAYQQGVAGGSSLSAFALESGFRGPSPSDRLNYVGLPNDPARSNRYRAIRAFFERNDRRNPKLPDINKIVPLPPAPLPAWDGTFQWEKEQAAAKPPEKPSIELIDRLAKDKHLDPATGLPLPGAPEKTSAS